MDVAWSVFGGHSEHRRSRKPAGQRPDGADGLPAAVLWDMDGTLVDTEPYWIETEYALAERHGGTWSAGARAQPGRQRPARLRRATSASTWASTSSRTRSSRSSSTASSPGSSRRSRGARGHVELLAALRAADVPCALVTMSYRRFVAPVLAALPAGHVRRIVTGDAVSQGKPHPEPYLHRGRGAGRRPGATAWPSRTPTPAPARPRPRGAPSWSCRTTCRC